MLRRVPIPLLCAGALAVAAGCGAGGKTPGQTTLLVSDAFGTKVLVAEGNPKLSGADTVMRLLQRNAKVTRRFGGKFVQSVDGLAGGSTTNGDPVDWFFYINGVEASEGATSIRVNGGDRVWFDRHDWQGAMDTPAVVGSYPEPFRHGIDGKRLPVRIECQPATSKACDDVLDNLAATGVPAAQGGLNQSATKDTLRVLVGDWRALRGDRAARQLESDPSVSGVFARMAPDGRRISLYNAHGDVVRTLGRGSGLIAAVSLNHGRPVWVVTGTDTAGINAAAGSLQQGVLADKFALATSGGSPIGLPLG